MPIDRIGKGGGIPPQAPASGPSETVPTKPFDVNASREAEKTRAVGAVGSSPLEQLRAGKIDVNQYVELKLDEATRHLKGLRASELSDLREVLRDKIAHDPQIVDLVRQATGHVPTPRDEG